MERAAPLTGRRARLVSRWIGSERPEREGRAVVEQERLEDAEPGEPDCMATILDTKESVKLSPLAVGPIYIPLAWYAIVSYLSGKDRIGHDFHG